MSGMEGGENWSKLCSLGGWVSTLALTLECEMSTMYLISFWCSKFEPSDQLLKMIFWDFKGGWCC